VKNHFLKYYFLIQSILLFLSIASFSQDNKTTFILKGNVYDRNSQEKLPGVNVYIKGTATGSATDENGNYAFKAPGGNHIIVFSFIGYKPQEKALTLNANKVVNISLEPDKEVLDEVQISAQRRFFGNMDYGRELPTISAMEISKLNVNNASDILHARIAGVWATKTSGAPGDQEKIRIRGQASFFSSAEPLYVIDGVPVPIVNLASLGISDLNIHDIDNVTVLKDASSSALYGFQGANGVILIDTKKKGDSKIAFSVKSGFQWFDNYYDLMNTKDFLESLDLAKRTTGSVNRNRYPVYTPSLCDHNRQDEIFKTGFLQEYQLSGNGKLKNLNYYLSGNYTNHKGIVGESQLKRYTFLTRVGTKIKSELALDLSYRFNYQQNNNNQNEYMGNRLIFEGISKAPCLECTPDSLLKTKDEILYNRNQTIYSLLNELTTPQDIINSSHHSYNFYTNAASLMGRYQFNNHLSINVIESFMIRKSNYTANSVYNSVLYKTYFWMQTVKLNSDETVSLLNHQANISYNNTFNHHEINLLLAHRYYADNLHWQVDSMNNTLPNHYYLRNSMAGYGSKGSVIRKIGSYIANFSYNYRQLYFLSAVANVSHLKEGLFVNYYSIFPSVAASWDLTKESFFAGNHWMNELNLYTNYGKSGNYPLNGLSNNLYEKVETTFGDSTSTHPYLSQFANHHLRHESTDEFDIGLKSAFFEKRLKFKAACFSKKIGNQIIQRDIPYYYGGGKIYINIGDIDVKGYEFDIEAIPIEQKGLSWTINANFSASKQKVTKLADDQDMVFRSTDILFPDFIISEGGKLGDIYGYKYLGKWTANDTQQKDIHYVQQNGFKYVNSDTIYKSLNEKDKVVIGNSIPKFNWNLMSSLQYKDFTFDFSIYSSWGMQKYNATRAGTILTGVNRDVNQLYSDTIKGINSIICYESSFFIEDASFIRLKNVSVSYEPKEKFLGVNYRLSLSVENLLTYTRYKGFDPEATIYTDNNFSDNAVDRGAYPNPKSVYLTIEIKL
jgi:TonB-dependent starch-binding outer membrane protein SusC